MKVALDNHSACLESGRALIGDFETLSVDFEGDLLSGYDRLVRNAADGSTDLQLSWPERREIAEYMIQRWKNFGGIRAL